MKLRKSVLSAAIVLGLGAAQAHAQDAANAEAARRAEHLRWHTWLRALRDGTMTGLMRPLGLGCLGRCGGAPRGSGGR